MNTIKPPALYRIETFGAGFRREASRDGQDPAPQQDDSSADSRKEPAMRRQRAAGPAPARASEFLIQLMVGGDADLRKALGRCEVAEQREAAYGAALANRPSARPLSFLRVIDSV